MPDTKAYGELIERLEARADHYNRRAEIMDRYADQIEPGDDYAPVAHADADKEHVLAATMRQSAAALRQLDEENRALRARVTNLEGAVDQAENGLNAAHLAMGRGSGIVVSDRLDVMDCFRRIRDVRLQTKEPSHG